MKEKNMNVNMPDNSQSLITDIHGTRCAAVAGLTTSDTEGFLLSKQIRLSGDGQQDMKRRREA